MAFLTLFLEDKFALDTTKPDYRDRVLEVGKPAEEAVFTFFAERGVTSCGSGSDLKYRRTLHRSGGLNTTTERYQRLLQTAAIKDPAPGYTQDILEIVSQ
ncbi:hypothetical protein PI124_g14227 [Phytophthora idaei]|nr:hypothetical protein PI125_g11501 [Phytophthora idaei]KAG3146955.1 hypothetical protein PI126_g13077 [Phytophthora idaei]KAG3240891.1 hypothetical protein PI124_g14227 [Phytophthora idaei]